MPPRRKGARTGFADLSTWAEPAPARPALTRGQVVQQALALLDEVGLDGLTMRRLAQRLGVQAASLYNHVRDKGELLALLADAICGEVPELDRGLSWRQRLEAGARDYRRVLLRHRDAARVLAATPPDGPMRLRLIDQLLGALWEAGLTEEEAVEAAFVANTFVTGFVLDETLGRPSAELTAEEVQAQMSAGFGSLPPERYPTLVALADHLGKVDLERAFGFGLRALLDGLEARLAGRPPRA
jgi:TetR/AcrR family tetracycline transcriptional repressor